MSTLWRIALAWMLALALPLQGHAATPQLAAAFQLTVSHASLPEPVAALRSAGHEGLVAASAHPCAGHDEAASTAGSPGSCSACASCCHAPALLPAMPRLPLVPSALPEIPVVRLSLAHVWQDAPERPPRPALR